MKISIREFLSSQGNFYSSFKLIALFIILLVTELIIMNILAMGQVVTIIRTPLQEFQAPIYKNVELCIFFARRKIMDVCLFFFFFSRDDCINPVTL